MVPLTSAPVTVLQKTMHSLQYLEVLQYAQPKTDY